MLDFFAALTKKILFFLFFTRRIGWRRVLRDTVYTYIRMYIGESCTCFPFDAYSSHCFLSVASFYFAQQCTQSNGVKECDSMREYERSFYSLFSGLLSLLCPGYAPATRREVVHAPRGLNQTRDVSFQRNARATDNDTPGLYARGDVREVRVSREIISQSRHVESEKPRNVGPHEWNQLFFLAQRRNSRRQMAFRKKDETRHNSCRSADPFEKQGNTVVRTFTLHPNAFNVGIHSCQSTGTISRSRASSRATLQQCADVTCSRGGRWNAEGERGSANLPVGTWQKFRHLLMSGIHFADARTPCLLSISLNYSVVCRFRFVYVSRATRWPKRRAKRKTDDHSAAPAPLPVEIFRISLGKKCLFSKRLHTISVDIFVHTPILHPPCRSYSPFCKSNQVFLQICLIVMRVTACNGTWTNINMKCKYTYYRFNNRPTAARDSFIYIFLQ